MTGYAVPSRPATFTQPYCSTGAWTALPVTVFLLAPARRKRTLWSRRPPPSYPEGKRRSGFRHRYPLRFWDWFTACAYFACVRPKSARGGIFVFWYNHEVNLAVWRLASKSAAARGNLSAQTALRHSG